MRPSIVLFLFLGTSFLAKAQDQTDLDQLLDSLLRDHRIDSIYMEELVYPRVKNMHSAVTNTAWFHGDTTALAPFSVKLHQKTYYKFGFKVVTFSQNERQSVWYFWNDKKRKSRFKLSSNQIVRVDAFNEEGLCYEYFERKSGVWYSYAASNNWEERDAQMSTEWLINFFGSTEEFDQFD